MRGYSVVLFFFFVCWIHNAPTRIVIKCDKVQVEESY